MTANEKAARKKKINHAITIIVLIILFLLFIAPFILVVINVFKVKADINTNPLALIGAHGFTWQNFPEAMKKMDFWNVFKNSAIITTCATILTILVSAISLPFWFLPWHPLLSSETENGKHAPSFSP